MENVRKKRYCVIHNHFIQPRCSCGGATGRVEAAGFPRDRLVLIETRSKAPREFYVSKKDAEKHGYTRGCGGCSSWSRGLGRQLRNEEEGLEQPRNLLQEYTRVSNRSSTIDVHSVPVVSAASSPLMRYGGGHPASILKSFN